VYDGRNKDVVDIMTALEIQESSVKSLTKKSIVPFSKGKKRKETNKKVEKHRANKFTNKLLFIKYYL
jgi:hypothetical protein